MQNKVVEQLKQAWQRMNPRQRMIVAGGTLAAVVGLVVLTVMMSSTDYKPLMTGLEPEDVKAISQQLAAKKIDFKMTPDGKEIDVAADHLDEARIEVASQGTTHSGRMGFELFDKSSWGQTEFDEKVNYQRALEGELERTIQTMSNVKSSRVHLVMATDSVFMDRERGAKASVTLRLKSGSLSRAEISEISRLVAGAVDELKPGDVVIIDADSNKTLGSSSASSDGSEGIEQEMTRRLISTLA